MTAPRQVLPGTTYLVTRRCSEQRYFLTPSKVTDAVFLYVLAVAAQRTRVEVHAFCVLSNHYHLLVTDRHAQLPVFMQYLDSLVARAFNAYIGRSEGFWASDTSYSAVAYGSTEDAVRKAAYVLANPVAAGLVRRGRDWPGLWSAPAQLGTAALTVPRPEVFFRAGGDMPISAELVLTVPPGFASAQEFRKRVEEAAGDLEAEARRERASKGRGFMGRAAILAQCRTAGPAKRLPSRKLKPRVAAIDTGRRIEALTRLREFLRAYREAWTARRAGASEYLFPAGTYLLRIEHGVPCAAFT